MVTLQSETLRESQPFLTRGEMMAGFLETLRKKQSSLFGKKSDDLWFQFVAECSRVQGPTVFARRLTGALWGMMASSDTDPTLRARYLVCLLFSGYYGEETELNWLPYPRTGLWQDSDLNHLYLCGLNDEWKHRLIRILIDFVSHAEECNLSGRYSVDEDDVRRYWQLLKLVREGASSEDQCALNMAVPTLYLDGNLVRLFPFYEKKGVSLDQKRRLARKVRESLAILTARDSTLLENENRVAYLLQDYFSAVKSFACGAELIPQIEFIVEYCPNGCMNTVLSSWDGLEWVYGTLSEFGDSTHELREKLLRKFGKDRLQGVTWEFIEQVCADFPEDGYPWIIKWKSRVRAEFSRNEKSRIKHVRRTEKSKKEADALVSSIISGWQILSANE